MKVIKVNKGTLGGDVFYGSVRINDNDVSVSNLIKDEAEHTFRMTGKVKAGFQTIRDYKGTIQGLICLLSKDTTVVEYKREYEDGTSSWFHILTTKGGKWYSIDKSLLEKLTVGDMHQAFSKMIDWNMWKSLNTTTWASKAFVMNK